MAPAAIMTEPALLSPATGSAVVEVIASAFPPAHAPARGRTGVPPGVLPSPADTPARRGAAAPYRRWSDRVRLHQHAGSRVRAPPMRDVPRGVRRAGLVGERRRGPLAPAAAVRG